MMPNTLIDPETEDLVPLADLGKRLGHKIHYFTVLGWVKYGRINHYTKRRVKLETVRLPNGYATSTKAYWRFVKQLNSLD